MSQQYQRVLIALAVHDSDASLIEAAQSVALKGVDIILLHVCEQSVSSWSDGASGGLHNPDMAAREAIFPGIKALAEQFGISASNIHIESGNAAEHIDEYAKRLGADLVVTGSHAKGGWRAHLGSVATAVINGAPCDVLTVRLKK